MSHRRRLGLLRLHPTAAWLALLEPAHYRGDRTGDRAEHLDGRTGANRWRVDLQGRRSEERISDGALDERRSALLSRGDMHWDAFLLRVEESPRRIGGWG